MEAAHVLRGEIDPVAAEVLGDVLEVFGDLQRGADGVGAADPLGGRGTGQGEHEAAHGIGGELAVGEEVRVRRVPRDVLVPAVGFDEPEEGIGGEAVVAHDGAQGQQQGVAGRAVGGAEDAQQVGLEGVEHGGAVVHRGRVEAQEHGVAAAGGEVAVADVVDEAGVAVDRRQALAPGAGQEGGGDGEVLRRGLGEGGAGVGVEDGAGGAGPDAGPGGHRPPPAAGTATAPGDRRIPIAIAVTSPVLHCRPKSSYFGHAAEVYPGVSRENQLWGIVPSWRD